MVKKYKWIMEVPMEAINVEIGKEEKFIIYFDSWHFIPQPKIK